MDAHGLSSPLTPVVLKASAGDVRDNLRYSCAHVVMVGVGLSSLSPDYIVSMRLGSSESELTRPRPETVELSKKNLGNA